MLRSKLLDLYFIEARSRLIDVAAFLDRIERAEGEDDYRVLAFRDALRVLAAEAEGTSQRAERVLKVFSDPTREPIDHAGGKAATGAWRGKGE